MKSIPHGKYPKNQKGFNLIKMMPELFRGIDFGDFSLTLGHKRLIDCWDGITFLFSSKYQENDGAKLVMMLSAIERSNNSAWKPLETVLKGKNFKLEMSEYKTGTEAYDFLNKSIEEYLDNFGSTRSLVGFFKDNLTERDKRIFTGGIRRSFTYTKQQIKDGILLTPTYGQKQETIDEELGRLLKSFIYNIRSGFVHKANYIIIPNKKYLKKRTVFELDTYDEGLPKEHWITILPFEKLHGLFCRAFIRYWRKEYFKKKKDTILNYRKGKS